GASCGNDPNGAAKVNITGGVAPFTYQWINETTNTVISTNAEITSVAAGNYEVNVTDANGCFGQQDITIVEKPVPSINAMSINSEVCFGEKTGSASATGIGGEGAFTYAWSNGATTQTVENLAGGTYAVTATDVNGCQASASIEITENPQIVINEQVDNLLCNSELGGLIVANVSGGTSPYSYVWSTGNTTNRISGIKAGTYFLTVTDAKGCQEVKGINISAPPAIEVVLTSENAADDQGSMDGSATVAATGGTAPYTYAWSNGTTTATADNLAAGTYTVTVTDANGCQQVAEVVVAATCTLMAEITNVRNVSCAGNDGSITVTTNGAQNGVNYIWTNGATTSAIAGLTPGFYGVTVTDGNGCEYASGAFVGDDCDCTQPILESSLVFEAECGESNGSLAINMVGNEADFTYRWSDPSVSGTGGNNLPAGSYTVTITANEDSRCTLVETINIGNTNVGPITIIQNEPETCNGQKGTVLLTPTALTYEWSDGGTGGFRDDLSAGEYLVTVTIPTLEGCFDILSINVGLESGLTLTPEINQRPDCGESNGSVTINVAGGSGNYSYSWGAATNNNLPSGTYSVVVTDQTTNCQDSVLFTLVNNVNGGAIVVDSIQNVSCIGSRDGKVQLIVSLTGDFVGPSTLMIVDDRGKTYDPEMLPAGNFCAVLRDANGCIAGEACFEITEPTALMVDVSVIPKTCSVENTILLTSRGGNGAYTYDWADQDGEINPRDRRAIENGTYSVTVTDEKGCSVPIDTIAIEGECFICALSVTASIETIPECGLPNGAVSINVDNSFGNLTYSWGESPNRTDLPAGTYTVTVTDDFRGCDTTVSFTLVEPDLPMEATISELIVCPDETGKLDYDLSNFRCFPQPTNVTITDDQGMVYDENALPAFGNYIFVVRDAEGTELNRQFFSVESYEPIIADANTLDEGCTTLGGIDLNLATDESNYTIQWEDLTEDNQSVDRTGLSEGAYIVNITDNNTGCSVTQIFVIDKQTGITADIDNLALTCDNAPVQLSLEGEGITSYEWTPAVFVMQGQGTATPTILANETEQLIQVKVTNAFGCEIEKEVRVVSVQTNPTGGISFSPQCDGLTVQFSSDSISSEYYRWNFGDGNTSDEVNPTYTYAEAGDYEVTLELKPEVPCAEERGIIANTNLNLVEDASVVADFDIKYDKCQDEGVISFRDISVANPGVIESWSWDFGNGLTSTEQNPIITLSEATNLEVTLEIKTNIGCGNITSETRAFEVVNLPKIAEVLQICPGVPTALNPNPESDVTYEWSPAELLDDPTQGNPIATTTKPVDFTVKITKGECVREENLRANVPVEQEYELSEDVEVCDDSDQLITVDGPADSQIEWTNTATGEIVGNVAEIMVAPGIYEVKLTDPNDCPVTDQVAVENFAIDANLINDTDPCTSGAGFLMISNMGEELTDIQWTDAEGIISQDLTTDQIEVEPSMTTDYEVTVKNEFGCEATLTETVKVSLLEEMVVIKERDTIFKGEFTEINIEPQGEYTVEWEISPTLENTSGFRNVASPEETTTYRVTITDTETNCQIQREVTVFVRDVFCGEPNIFFPNAFSPNGDGANDVLFVRGSGLDEVYFAVYNRWGEQVFESNSQDIGWDGTFNGEMVETDVYGYYLKVTCFSGEIYETQGNVTVLN
ncbi:MAG: PKD domain-containing protein, partial [Bacteroidota bacterium]